MWTTARIYSLNSVVSPPPHGLVRWTGTLHPYQAMCAEQTEELVRMRALAKQRLEDENYHEKYQACKIALESAEARAVIADAEVRGCAARGACHIVYVLITVV